MAEPTLIRPDVEQIPSVFDPPSTEVKLGTGVFQVKEVPIGRAKRFKTLWLSVTGNVTSLMAGGDMSDSDTIGALFSLLTDEPGNLLAIVIPEFDPASCDDEENGPTIPEIKHALDVAITVNGLEFLREAVPFVVRLIRVTLVKRAMGEA